MSLLLVALSTIIGLIVGVFIGKSMNNKAPIKTKLVGATAVKELLKYENGILTAVTIYSNGRPSITREYQGNCTVWHELPNFRRCSTLEECALHEKWSAYNHLRKHPDYKLSFYELLK